MHSFSEGYFPFLTITTFVVKTVSITHEETLPNIIDTKRSSGRISG